MAENYPSKGQNHATAASNARQRRRACCRSFTFAASTITEKTRGGENCRIRMAVAGEVSFRRCSTDRIIRTVPGTVFRSELDLRSGGRSGTRFVGGLLPLSSSMSVPYGRSDAASGQWMRLQMALGLAPAVARRLRRHYSPARYCSFVEKSGVAYDVCFPRHEQR